MAYKQTEAAFRFYTSSAKLSVEYFASDHYDPDDYIRNYNEFMELNNANQ